MSEGEEVSGEKKLEQSTREIMDKIYAMTPEEVNRLLAEKFRRMCSKPLPADD